VSEIKIVHVILQPTIQTSEVKYVSIRQFHWG